MIAKKTELTKSTHYGKLEVGRLIIPCYVLADGKRVLSGRGMQEALELGQTSGGKINQLVRNKDVSHLVSNDLELGVFEPIIFKGNTGFKTHGYEAHTLVDLCDMILEARHLGVLPERYHHVATQAEILTRSFAKVGIVALIDEVTGYQLDRRKDELQKILQAYISAELLPWQKRFPDEFYKQMFRLRGWPYDAQSIKRKPSVIGIWTNKLIYDKLPEGVLKELKEKTPKDSKGRRKHKFHQLLSIDVGHPSLSNQLASVITLMKASSTWRKFESSFNRAFGQGELDFTEND